MAVSLRFLYYVGGRLGPSLDLLAAREPFWVRLGGFLDGLEPFWNRLGGFLDGLGNILAGSWRRPERVLARLGGQDSPQGKATTFLEVSWTCLGFHFRKKKMDVFSIYL